MTVLTKTEEDDRSLYDAVLDDITTGVLQGGQRLKVAELAARYGVSTSPVREVLRRMQGEGYVDISPNRGATIRVVDMGTIQSIFELLQLLEPYFVKWFAEFAQPEMLDEMTVLQTQIEALTPQDAAAFRKLDAAFHLCICKRHYNTRAVETWQNLRRALNVHGARLKVSRSRHRQIIKEHRALLAAFADNDVTVAAAVIRTHLEGSFVQMTQQMRMIGLPE